MSRLLVFEGVFDPPHIGHFWVAQQAKEHFKDAQLLICPATDIATTEISDKPNASSYSLRVNMCELGFPNALVYKHENKYTIDLVNELNTKFGFLDLSIIHGPDWDPKEYNRYDLLKNMVTFYKIDCQEIKIRSTMIRKRLAQGLSIQGLVFPAVEILLKDHKYNV